MRPWRPVRSAHRPVTAEVSRERRPWECRAAARSNQGWRLHDANARHAYADALDECTKKQNPESDYFELLIRTGAQRLRPVVLTSATTILGLLPLASNLSIDLINRTIIFGSSLSAFWVPLSQAIVSGLSVATILTLVTTPAMLALPYQLKRFINQRMNKKTPTQALTS